MGQPGFGVMVGMLGGNRESVEAFTACVGKTIAALAIDDNELRFAFEDGTGLALLDDGQSCCEHRYMHTDDDLSAHVGASLIGAEVADGPTISGEYGEEKECAFLKVTTSAGALTVANYNEHNGYYGGFWIIAKPLRSKAESH